MSPATIFQERGSSDPTNPYNQASESSCKHWVRSQHFQCIKWVTGLTKFIELLQYHYRDRHWISLRQWKWGSRTPDRLSVQRLFRWNIVQHKGLKIGKDHRLEKTLLLQSVKERWTVLLWSVRSSMIKLSSPSTTVRRSKKYGSVIDQSVSSNSLSEQILVNFWGTIHWM